MAGNLDLLSELRTAQAECTRLREENTRLREQLEEREGSVDAVPPIAQNAAVTNASSPDAKIALFRELFRGRDDVYAVRWVARNGHSGYSPAAPREGVGGKASAIKNRQYFPLTDAVVRNHLLGKHTIGVYPLLLDEACWFLAVDFDKQDWQRDVLAFLTTCRESGVHAGLERSRSGNGGHVWIFFDSPVPASLARKLGSYLLTRAMERRHSIGLHSYDRLFPNQDTMPKGGFGNLIALPLQRGPRAQGNTVFVDENLIPFSDQWAFLFTVKRLSRAHAERVLKDVSHEAAVIGIRRSVLDLESGDAPWALPLTDSEDVESAITGPLPERVRVVRGNLLYVEKKDLPSAMLNRLMRLAAFQNPEFYRAQAMRLSTYGKPRVIGCGAELPNHIGLPRGSLDELLGLLEAHSIKDEIDDQRFSGKQINASFRGKLTAEQLNAGRALRAHDDGILCAPTAFGKTVVAAWLLAERKTNTLVLVHRRQLMDQWRERLTSFLELSDTEIGQIGGGKNSSGQSIDIAVMQSLVRKGEVKKLVGEYGHIIVDECHHVSAFTFERILRQAKAKYVLGLTATPVRKDGHQPIILMQCGPIRFNLSAKKLGATQAFAHRVIPRFTNFSVPREWSDITIQDLYTALALDDERTEMIAADLLRAVEAGRSPLLLTERKDHLNAIAERLKDRLENLFVLHGGVSKKKRDELAGQIGAVPETMPRVILATGRYIGEGFDDARLDTLFLALPISWRGTLQQYVGRLHRLHDNKRVVQVYDYVDYLVPMLARMYDRRVKSYKAIGYLIDEPAEAPRHTSELRFAEIERAAIQAAIDYENARGWQVESVEHETRGFDLISREPGLIASARDSKRRFIEVKGRAYRGPVSLSANEYSTAKRLGQSYWLYVVFNCASAPEVHAIQNPARLQWKALSKIDQYQVGAGDILKAER